MNRRSFLTLCSGALTATSGCAGPLGDGRLLGGSPTRIDNLHATNYRTSPQEFHVIISEGGERIYEESKMIPGLENGIPGGAEFSNAPTKPGTYLLTAYINDQPKDEWEHLDIGTEFEVSCIDVLLEIGHLYDDFSIWYTVDCDWNNSGGTSSNDTPRRSRNSIRNRRFDSSELSLGGSI